MLPTHKTDITAILEWFKQAKPNPTNEDACVQIGCHYEEVAEMALVLSEHINDKGDMVDSMLNKVAATYKDKDDDNLEHLKTLFNSELVELLDSLCDQIVTAIGVAYMMGFDIQGALNEVNRSNWSKFVDGKPIFNEQGKIAKPESYSPPDLTNFIHNK